MKNKNHFVSARFCSSSGRVQRMENFRVLRGSLRPGVETGRRIAHHTHTPRPVLRSRPPTHPPHRIFRETPGAQFISPRSCGAGPNARQPEPKKRSQGRDAGREKRERQSNGGGGIHPPSCSPLHALSSGLLFVPHSLSREPRVDKGGVKEGRRLRGGSQGKKKELTTVHTHTHTKMHAQGVAGDMKYDGPRSEATQTAPPFFLLRSGVQG